MRNFVLLAITAAGVFLASSTARALPRFALLMGAKCGSCHVNPTGGQIRSEYGSQWGGDKLSLQATHDDDFTFSPKLSENLSFGLDYRSQFIYDQTLKQTTFQSMTTSLYGAVRLSRKITFLFKQDLVNGTYGSAYNGTEVYGVAKVLPGNWYIKGGLFLPDFGWRQDDHTAYVRGGDFGIVRSGGSGAVENGLIFTPNYSDLGVEVGGYLGDLMITGGVFNGTGHNYPIDFSKDKAYAAKVEYMGSVDVLTFRVGASGYGFRNFKIGGFTAGFATAESALVVMGEMDWTQHYYDPLLNTVDPNSNAMAAYAEADYRVIQGVWVTGRFDMFDPVEGLADNDLTPATNARKRVTAGLELFPYSFVEIRPQYRFAIEKPRLNDDLGLVQIHLWF